MTYASRFVLLDCSFAYNEFKGDVVGARWRLIYMANIALLRTVYHVLKQRDAAANPRLASAVKRWDADLLRSKPKPEIYWEFIVSERNQLLKEYQSAPVRNVVTPEIEFDLSTGKTRELGTLRQHYLMEDGIFEGEDQRRLIKRAIEWWVVQLDALDQAASAA